MSTAIEVRERPILMSGEMVRAILGGRKTQTRRVVKPQPPFCGDLAGPSPTVAGAWNFRSTKYPKAALSNFPMRCPYGQPGDRLYVRETWATDRAFDHLAPKDIPESAQSASRCCYRQGLNVFTEGWHRLRPSIHMPRWASRIDLEVTGVRVERVRDICELECYAEGVSQEVLCEPDDHIERVREDFHALWDSLNAKRGYGWDSNPWVWVIEFAPAVSTPEEAKP